MARECLLSDLRPAIKKSPKTGSTFTRNDISVWVQNAFREVGLEVIPLPPNVKGERFLLVLFHGAPTPEPPAKPKNGNDKKAARNEIEKPPTREVQRLKQELKATHEYLQSVIEEQEAGNEEIRYANEEIQSRNEE